MGRVLGGVAVIGAVALAAGSLAGCGSKKGDSGASTTTTNVAGTTGTTGPAQTLHGKMDVVGDLTVMYAGGAAIDPIPTPFTFTVPDAGRGGLDLPEATVNGSPNTIIWSGGRPLPVTGTCKLDVGEADIRVDSGGAHVQLDGAVRALTAGSCAFGSSVAVGVHGLSSPEPSVSFTLPKDADFTTSGGAAVTVAGARRYEGRTGNLGLYGQMRVTTENDEFNAAAVAVTKGTWVVTITATTTGAMHLVAQLEGDLVVNRA